MKPYHLQMAHTLEENDYISRVTFAQDELGQLAVDSGRLNNMFFSDEAHFHLCGGINRQNWIMWADENPHWFDVRQLHPGKWIVWMGFGIEDIISPVFWQPRGTENGIDSSWMMSLLVDHVIPELRTWPNSENLIFQMDGAEPHSTNMVLELLSDFSKPMDG